jgi:hypothetical protein
MRNLSSKRRLRRQRATRALRAPRAIDVPDQELRLEADWRISYHQPAKSMRVAWPESDMQMGFLGLDRFCFFLDTLQYGILTHTPEEGKRVWGDNPESCPVAINLPCTVQYVQCTIKDLPPTCLRSGQAKCLTFTGR